MLTIIPQLNQTKNQAIGNNFKSNPNQKSGYANSLQNDVFVRSSASVNKASKNNLSFGSKYSLPIAEIEELGKKYMKTQPEEIKTLQWFNDYTKAVRDEMNNTIAITKPTEKELEALSETERNAKISDHNDFQKFVEHYAHETTGSYLADPQVKIMLVDKTNPILPIEEQNKIAVENRDLIINHVNESSHRYQSFLDNDMYSRNSTIGAENVFKMVKEAFAKTAENKNLQWVIKGEDLLKEHSQSTYCDFKNYLTLSNAVGNANKYSKPNGVIEMGFKINENDSHLRFYIKDQGIGVLPEDHTKIFQAARGSNTEGYAGTGHGMYSSNRIVFDETNEPIKVTSPLYPEEEKFKGSMFEFPLISDITKTFTKKELVK